MAGRKFSKKLCKLISRVAQEKGLRRGVKEVVLALRKSEKGVVVFAGDVFPVEVMAHIPLVCEEAGIPYCYIATKTQLGMAALTKRPTSVVLISEGRVKDDDLNKQVAEAMDEVRGMKVVYTDAE